MAACTNGLHSLVKLLERSSNAAPDATLVVRWCSNCGAVVIDTDIDGRTVPGDVMKMRFPAGNQST